MFSEFTLIFSGSSIDQQVYSVLTRDCTFEEINLTPQNGEWRFTLSNSHVPNVAWLHFLDSTGTPTNPSPDQKLYLASGSLSLKVQEGQLIFSPSSPDSQTVYLQIPANQNLGYNDIRARNWLFVGSIPLISLLEVDLKNTRFSLAPPISNNVLIPDPNNNSIFIGPICLPKCDGKSCGPDGCGGICSCPLGSTCNNGQCQSSPCSENAPCGDKNGRCSGTCSGDQICQRDVNGYFKCLPKQNWQIVVFLIGFFLILILLILIFILASRK